MLKLSHIKKSYKKNEVLTDISFTFEEGQIYPILGGPGAGRTTLFECICGDISPLKFQFNIPSMDGWFKKRFIPWCQEQPVEQVYLIAGNHDRFMESRTYTIHKHLLGTKINYLEDSLCEYVDGNGKIWKIWGTPWCHIFGNLSFMRSPEIETEKFSLQSVHH